MIHPVLEFGDVIYDSISLSTGHALESVQRNAAGLLWTPVARFPTTRVPSAEMSFALPDISSFQNGRIEIPSWETSE